MGRVGEIWWRPRARRLLLMAAAAGSIVAGAASAREFSDWGAPVRADSLSGSSAQVNTPSSDGCPILSPYDNDLYMASNRPGSVLNGSNLPSLDIWIAHWNGSGWDTPVNAGPQINTAADEFCPDPARGNRLFFVRRLSSTNTDIYLSKKLPNGFTTPQPLPRGDEAINSPAEEWSPSYFEAGGREFLYFSSTRQSSPGHDIFYSVNFGPAQFAPGGVNSSASDARPNVRHDGLEIVWDSTRTGSQLTDGGMQMDADFSHDPAVLPEPEDADHQPLVGGRAMGGRRPARQRHQQRGGRKPRVPLLGRNRADVRLDPRRHVRHLRFEEGTAYRPALSGIGGVSRTASGAISRSKRAQRGHAGPAPRPAAPLGFRASIFPQDREQDQSEGGEPDQVQRPALLGRDVGEREDALPDPEQAEGQREGKEQAVARTAPEPGKEQTAGEEAEGDCAGQKVVERHRLTPPRYRRRSPRSAR